MDDRRARLRRPLHPVKRTVLLDSAPMTARRALAGGVALIVAAVGVLYYAKQNPVSFVDVHPEVAPIEPELVAIPGGSFTMGDDARGRPLERPAHGVEIAPFRIGKYEVTNEEYR